MVRRRIPTLLCGLLLACNVLATHPTNPDLPIARSNALNPRDGRPPSARGDDGDFDYDFDSDNDPDDDDDDYDDDDYPSSWEGFGRFGEGEDRPGRWPGTGSDDSVAGGDSTGSSGEDVTGFDRGDGRGGREGTGRGGVLSFDREKAMQVRNVHGVLAAVTFVGVFPLGAVILRVATGHVWLHAGVQILGYCAFVAAAGLGIWLTTYVRIRSGATMLTDPSVNFHPIIGLLVLAALTLQPIFGLLHHARFKRLRRRQIWSHLHLWTGRIAVPLGMINGALGLVVGRASKAVLASYAVVATVVWLVWMAFAVWSERRRRRAGVLARAVEESAAKREEEEREREERERRGRDSRSS